MQQTVFYSSELKKTTFNRYKYLLQQVFCRFLLWDLLQLQTQWSSVDIRVNAINKLAVRQNIARRVQFSFKLFILLFCLPIISLLSTTHSVTALFVSRRSAAVYPSFLRILMISFCVDSFIVSTFFSKFLWVFDNWCTKQVVLLFLFNTLAQYHTVMCQFKFVHITWELKSFRILYSPNKVTFVLYSLCIYLNPITQSYNAYLAYLLISTRNFERWSMTFGNCWRCRLLSTVILACPLFV